MTHSLDHLLIVTSDAQVNFLLDRVLRSNGYAITTLEEGADALKQADHLSFGLMIVGEKLKDGSGIDFAAEFLRLYPSTPILLFVNQDSPDLLKRVMRLGVNDYLTPPLRAEEILRAVKNAMDLANRRKEAQLLEARRYSTSLQHQLDDLEVISQLGREVTGSLDVDKVLAAVIDAAIQITQAEEGSLLLIDEQSGELYMRAARNFQDEFARTFRTSITDSLAGSVIRTGEAVLMDENTPQKIKTAYLVQSLAYVPLELNGHVIGVLGVDNRQNHMPLTQRHVKLLKVLAGYAVTALENARLYNDTLLERNRLETILTNIQDGVIILDTDLRLVLINRMLRDLFKIPQDQSIRGKLAAEVIPNQEEVIDLIQACENGLFNRIETEVDANHVFSAEAVKIPEVGIVVTMNDITNLKKLDRIKSDFVHSVSHDLRTPLTAIAGYVELLDRVGPINDTQRDFVRRVLTSVTNMTRLMDDLLELGRVEAGFDENKEALQAEQIIQLVVDESQKQLNTKNLTLTLDMAKEMPTLVANPIQLHQIFNRLLDNAIKYTHPGGKITVSSRVEENQVIVQVADTGIGIPPMDLPYVFEKFYRAINASLESPGAGLGLSIVKSAVEAHGGRVWVDSTLGECTVFTVVLPLSS